MWGYFLVFVICNWVRLLFCVILLIVLFKLIFLKMIVVLILLLYLVNVV